jgi:MerR family transcriptional regulator/heat shock protein HspR
MADESESRRKRPEDERRPNPEQGSFSSERGVFMISVAAELAGMHPQTLRVYEARGLIKPSRSPKQTRLYSQRDVERLRRIQELTTDFGLNLAGVERVLEMELTMTLLHEQLAGLRQEAELMRQRMLEEIEAVHRSYKAELVPWQPPGAVLRAADAKAFKIPIYKNRQADGGTRRPPDGTSKEK